MLKYIKLIYLLAAIAFTPAINPYYVIVKSFDANNQNALLNTVVFTYSSETQRDSAFEETINYYNQVVMNLGGYAFLDTAQNTLIVIDRK